MTQQPSDAKRKEEPTRDTEGHELPGADNEELPPVTCQNCGGEVSKLEPVCPHCGHPLVGA
jgi:DNA-directed RNA polymerase subunit RPC12/RpoP